MIRTEYLLSSGIFLSEYAFGMATLGELGFLDSA